ncbi:hypothetical protein [Patulibacter defluvii]|uniref:hypothetical protein n=1 Tax=Patulibacter defluvii TaxID=3095358 RepID=UPI002A754801|nr:hypothetical protein [Patulibacter sp. DM4]
MTRIRTTAAVASTAAAALALTPASPASAAVLKGLQDQQMTVNEPGLTPAFLSAAKEAKVRLVRFNTRWDGQASVPDGAQIAAIRAFAQQAAASGSGVTAIEVSPNVSGDESFNPRRKKGPTAASKISVSAYRSYIRALAEGLKDLPLTRYYAPLNEPNWFRHIPKRGAGTVYRKIHNTAYEQIKAVDPKAQVLFGELLPYDRAKSRNYPYGQSTDAGTFVREVLGLRSNWKPKGKTSTYKVKADGVSLHTYDFKADPRKKRKDRDDWTQANLGYAKADLKKAAKSKRISSKAAGRIFLTEFAYKTAGSDKLSTSKASTYLKRAWTIAKKQKVRSFLWYQLRDPTSAGEMWKSGLQTATGGSRRTWTTFRGLK